MIKRFLEKIRINRIKKEVEVLSKIKLGMIINALDDEISIEKEKQFIRFLVDDEHLLSIGDDFLLCFWFGYKLDDDMLFMVDENNDRRYIENSEFRDTIKYYLEKILEKVEKILDNLNFNDYIRLNKKNGERG